MNENELLQIVCVQNKRLAELGLVILTEGNVSCRQGNILAIKPSGMAYETMTPEQMVLVSIKTGKILVNNGIKPSVDTPIHLEIYRRFPEVGGIAHTHSLYATIFAQNCQPISCVWTTHADAFCGDVPVTLELTKQEHELSLEVCAGHAVANRYRQNIPAVLLRHHGPFTFGKNAEEAVNNALILEKVAFLAFHTKSDISVPPSLLQKHFSRKHGEAASYGQPS